MPQNSDIVDSVITDNRMNFSVPIGRNNRYPLVYIEFQIYRMNFTVRRDPIYPSSAVKVNFIKLTWIICVPDLCREKTCFYRSAFLFRSEIGHLVRQNASDVHGVFDLVPADFTQRYVGRITHITDGIVTPGK